MLELCSVALPKAGIDHGQTCQGLRSMCLGGPPLAGEVPCIFHPMSSSCQSGPQQEAEGTLQRRLERTQQKYYLQRYREGKRNKWIVREPGTLSSEELLLVGTGQGEQEPTRWSSSWGRGVGEPATELQDSSVQSTWREADSSFLNLLLVPPVGGTP